MRISKEFILLISSIFIVFLFLELTLRYLEVNLPSKDYDSELYQNYSKQEIDDSLLFRHPNYGGECIKRKKSKKMLWHPRFGYRNKDLDIDCVNSLFEKDKINIVFMGGSAMANYETPNYLTSIENYMFEEDEKFRSINLAESGARLSNELSIFLEYIPKFKNKPDFVIFFDGYNEFLSIRYNGNPDNDFYWTAGGNRRIHKPFMYYFDLISEKSYLIKFIRQEISKIFSKNKSDELQVSKIIESADEYIYRMKILEKLCNVYDTKCIFVLQPIFVLTDGLNGKSDKQIKEWHEVNFKNDKKIYEMGYNRIIESSNKIYDLRSILDRKSGTYFDYVHSNKTGSKIIGVALKNILNNELNIN